MESYCRSISCEAVWATVAFATLLLAGIAGAYDEVAREHGLRKLMPLGLAFAAAALAAFGIQHFYESANISRMIPEYFPLRRPIAFAIGFCLFAAAASFAARKLLHWSLLLFGGMIAIIIALIHLPNVFREPHENLLWMVLLRDTGFAVGALAYASLFWPGRFARAGIPTARIMFALILIVFAVSNLAHLHLMGGVPLKQAPPPWFIGTAGIAAICGVVLFAGGAAMLVNWRASDAAFLLGGFMAALTVFPYLFILVRSPWHSIDPIDFVADTLLFSAASLWMGIACDSKAPRTAGLSAIHSAFRTRESS